MRYDINRYLVEYVAKSNEAFFKTVLMTLTHKYFQILNKINSDFATYLKVLSIYEIVSN